MTTSTTSPRPCGCSEPDRYTIARLPDGVRIFQIRQRARRLVKRTRMLAALAYGMALATVPAAILDGLTQGQIVWGWPVLGFVLVVLARTWDVGTPGARGQYHEAGDGPCALEVFAANRIHAKQEAEREVGKPGTPHEERGAYAAQQREFWRQHEGDLERFELSLTRHQNHEGE